MYRIFKEELESKKSQFDAQENEVYEKLTRCWDSIDKQCSDSGKEEVKQAIPAKAGGWRTVRIFVSSTFTDFYNEREILIKQVFPELREWSEARRIQLIDCDLRWGIPKDSTTGETIAVCLEELDVCHETNEGEPFFLNMTCDRYGWVPSESDIPEEVRERYNWVPDTSITFMEILHGALRKANSNAVFFIRNNDFISKIPKDHKERFKDSDAYSQEQLKLLTLKLREKFPKQIFDYDVKYNGLVEILDKDMVSVIGLETFASQVLEFFKTAISKKYPVQTKTEDITMEESEMDLQWGFITEKAESVIGRERDIQTLLSFVKNTKCDIAIREKCDPSSRKLDGWSVQDTDNKLCIIEAKSGWGKTSLLAKITSSLVHEGADVFYHFCGSTNRSRQEDNVIQRLLHFLNIPQTEQKSENGQQNEEEETKPKKLLQDALKEIRQSNRSIILIFDAVNELTSMESRNHLSWLPPSTSANVRCIVSSNQHAPTLARLEEHPCFWYTLSAMDETNLKELAVSYLGAFKKRLDDEQLDLLVHGTGADNPQWVRLMCEELRVFGDFRSLTGKIRDLPKTLDGLFSTIFSRLLHEDSTGCIKKALCLIAVSYTGLPLADILKILGDVVKDEIILVPQLHWAQARRHLKPYIRTVGYPHELLTFSHESLWKAVDKILLTNATERIKWHVCLADYFQNICENSQLRTESIPYHLSRANLGKRMIEFLQKDKDASKITDYVRSNYLQRSRCKSIARPQFPGTKEVKFCAFCSNKKSTLKPDSMWPAKDSCIICGSHVFATRGVAGRMCSFHGFGAPNQTKCFTCQNIIWDKQPVSMNKAKGLLCTHCGFGNNGSMCAVLDPKN